jgi:thiol-disulfide isomerase/thioredoxin
MSLRLKTPMPSLEGATKWINAEPDLSSLEGKPVLVYFWAVSCHICHENMPKLIIWRETYGQKDLEMISIHCPRMKTDTDLPKVKSAVINNGITEPCGIDNLHKIKKAFENELWPAYFLFDRDGKLKCRAAGNAGLPIIEPAIRKLLK